MTLNSNLHDSNSASNCNNSHENKNEIANLSITNSHVCITSTTENSCSYSSFNMNLILNYTNNQIHHYFTTDAISAINQACFQQLMKQQKVSLNMIE